MTLLKRRRGTPRRAQSVAFAVLTGLAVLLHQAVSGRDTGVRLA
jgi:hypothetical protein